MSNSTQPRCFLLGLFRWLGPLLLLTAPLSAQPATGTIEGRVVHAATGRYLGNVRVTVEGTALETFTDELGAYRIDGILAGTATLKVFFTGLAPYHTPIVIIAGQTATRDVTRMDCPACGRTGRWVVSVMTGPRF